MTRFTAFAIFAFYSVMGFAPAAHADDRHFDRSGTVERHWDNGHRYDNHTDHDHYDRGFERNFNENQRYWNNSYNNRTYERQSSYREGYRAGLQANNYNSTPTRTIIIGRQRPYDYSPYSSSSTVIYGDGNLTPLPRSSVYYYGNR